MYFTAELYNTPQAPAPTDGTGRSEARRRKDTVARCPDCDAEIDLDEDEVEEGEIMTCPECDVELEVVQVHPVQLNSVSEDGDELEEDEEESLEDEDDDEEEEDEGYDEDEDEEGEEEDEDEK
jgi:lysine biosynthesis protein LysW